MRWKLGVDAGAPGARGRSLGGTGVLLAASVLAMVLGFAEKMPCRSGAWNYYIQQFQDACYTDIYPLYYTEGLAAGKVPYTGHPVEYPVLIGGAMQAAAWLVRGVDSVIRGREFFDVTVVLLAVCAVAGVLATARAAGPDGRLAGAAGRAVARADPVRVHQLGPDRDGADRAGHGGLGGAARRVGGRSPRAWRVATKFYPLVFFGALLLLCLRAGRMREFARTFAAGRARLAGGQPAGHDRRAGRLGPLLRVQPGPGADWGSIWYLFEYYGVPVLGNYQLSTLNMMSAAVFVVACAGHRPARLGRAAPAPAAAAVLPAAGRVPDPEQGLVAAVRDLAGAAGGAGPAALVAVRPVAARRGLLLLRHLGLPDRRLPSARASRPGYQGISSELVFRRARWPGSSP